MRYKTLACPSLVAYSLLSPAVIVFVPLFFTFMGNGFNRVLLDTACSLLLIWTSMVIFMYLFFHNAFRQVKMDSEKVENKNVNLPWVEIGHVEICSVKLLEWSLFPTIEIDMLCLSRTNGDRSFYRTDKDCIFIFMSKKNLQALATFSNGRSECLDEMVRLFL